MMTDAEGYRKYRGKCREACEAIKQEDHTLTLVRGTYYCPIWGSNEEHWWCVDKDGKIVDPTAEQFPSKGLGFYTPFDGYVECAQCGKKIQEEKAEMAGRFPVCDGRCYGRLVGVSV
jgi:hypothetical protein